MTDTQEFQNADFVRVSYTARVADTDRIIDTTDSETAETAALADLTADGPVTVIVGAGQLFDPVEAALRETPVGETIVVTVPPEAGFGEPSREARRVVDAEAVDVDTDALEPGDRVRHDGAEPFVEAVDDGHVTLNFDHPLAGVELEYELTPVERVTDPDERVRGLLASYGFAGPVGASLDDGTLRLSLTPDDTEGWAERKAELVADAREYLPVERVRVVEDYPASGSR